MRRNPWIVQKLERKRACRMCMKETENFADLSTFPKRTAEGDRAMRQEGDLDKLKDHSIHEYRYPVLEAPPTFFGGRDPFCCFPPEYLHLLCVGIVKKTFELILEYIELAANKAKLSTLNRRAVKLNEFIRGMPRGGW